MYMTEILYDKISIIKEIKKLCPKIKLRENILIVLTKLILIIYLSINNITLQGWSNPFTNTHTIINNIFVNLG